MPDHAFVGSFRSAVVAHRVGIEGAADFDHVAAGGAPFEPGHFTWLCLAGMLLGLVFRLRGPGVAAWCHGLFNLGLYLGVDPDVLL